MRLFLGAAASGAASSPSTACCWLASSFVDDGSASPSSSGRAEKGFDVSKGFWPGFGGNCGSAAGVVASACVGVGEEVEGSGGSAGPLASLAEESWYSFSEYREGELCFDGEGGGESSMG